MRRREARALEATFADPLPPSCTAQLLYTVAVIFIPVFAQNIETLLVGQILSGVRSPPRLDLRRSISKADLVPPHPPASPSCVYMPRSAPGCVSVPLEAPEEETDLPFAFSLLLILPLRLFPPAGLLRNDDLHVRCRHHARPAPSCTSILYSMRSAEPEADAVRAPQYLTAYVVSPLPAVLAPALVLPRADAARRICVGSWVN